MSQRPSTRRISCVANDKIRSTEFCKISSPTCYIASRGKCNPDKHNKVLAHGKQIKTHLLCQHLVSKPVWGAGTSARKSDSQQDYEERINHQRMIDQKIDRLCLPGSRKSPRNNTKENMKNTYVKHRKILSGGQQLKTHLICEHLKKSPHIRSNGDAAQDGSSRNYASLSDDSDSSDTEPVALKPVLKELPNSIFCNEKLESGRRIFASVNSPDYVPIVDVRGPCVSNLSPWQSSHQDDSSFPAFAGDLNSRFTRKRVRFEDEISKNLENIPKGMGKFSPNSRFEDTVRDRKPVGNFCTLCGKKLESFEYRPSSDRDGFCYFCGSSFSNFEESHGCEYCSCYQGTGRCWAVQAYENSDWDGDVGMAQCNNFTHEEKDYDESYRRPSKFSRNKENFLPPSAAALKPTYKYQAKRHSAAKAYDHQCVHQYHQNSRLFLEPTAPDSQGRSTCQLCGLTLEDDSCLAHAGTSLSEDRHSDDSSERSERKVSFDLPRSFTTTSRSTTAQDRRKNVVNEVGTKGRATHRQVSSESDGVLRRSSSRASLNCRASPAASHATHSVNRCPTSIRSRSKLVNNDKDPLFVLSIDPVLRERTDEDSTKSTVDSLTINRGLPMSHGNKRNSVRSSCNARKRNPAHSMALDDHI